MKFSSTEGYFGEGVFDKSKNYKLYNEYDTAIKYIDSSLKEVMKCMGTKFKKNPQPMVFIYFSDHGESPATARGHDSSRLTYEMLHVPFAIFFNDKAFELYKDKFTSDNVYGEFVKFIEQNY